jgi:integrase
MARKINQLTAKGVEGMTAENKGYHHDGEGLYLQVSKSGSKSWVFRYKRGGKRRDMGLGSYPTVSLAKARVKAKLARELHVGGKDPIEEREREVQEKKAAELQQRLIEAQSRTFKDVAEEWLKANKARWRSAKHQQQWSNSLRDHAYPIIGGVPVSDITTAHMLKILLPIWNTKTVTANRVRGRIERVLAYAKKILKLKLHDNENVAVWRNNLDAALPKPSEVHEIKPFEAMPYEQVPAFMAKLRATDGVAARALELAILAGGRTKEVRRAPFTEFILEAKEWNIPAARMKGKRPHRVPLCDRVVAIVKEMAASRSNDFVFPGRDYGALQEMRMWLLLQELAPAFTVHGFRSSFKDWASEQTRFADHVSETALAHKSADKVRGAYARSDLFDMRRELMEAWARFCQPAPKLRVVDDEAQAHTH